MSVNRDRAAAPPQLTTLDTKPSWQNRAGWIDRSACFVITASQLWRRIPDDQWTYRLGLPPSEQWRLNHPRPASDVRGIKGVCDRYADLTLWARGLWELHKWEQPYPLQGDFRSAKSNALRHTPRPIGQRGDRPSAQQMRQDAVLGQGPINPNRGVGFKLHKRLGLPADWSTTLRIERIVQHAQLRQHFLVCPVCSSQNTPRRAHLSGPAHTPNPLAPERATKLYLPLCTPQEYDDAQLAQLWLQIHPRNITHPNAPLPPAAAALIERYGELFQPRQLRCRQCLGLRYGEVKPSSAPLSRRERAGVRGRPPVEQQRSIPTEQALFLQNLPKLLAKPDPDNTPQPPGHARADKRSKPRPRRVATADNTLASDHPSAIKVIHQTKPSAWPTSANCCQASRCYPCKQDE